MHSSRSHKLKSYCALHCSGARDTTRRKAGLLLTYKSGLSTGNNKLTDHARKSGVRRIMKEKPKALVGKALAL